MKKNLTEMVFILDKSGSMYGLEKDTIGGFNSMIDDQKKVDGDAYVTTILFSSSSRILHDRVKIADIKDMTDKDYIVGGNTALIDAVGDAVKHIENIHKYARKEDVPERTVFVITTDGQENSSRKYTSDAVKKLIEEKKKIGWEFLFIGANIDAVETAAHFGIDKNRAVNYHADSVGTGVVYGAISKPLRDFRNSKNISNEWSKPIDKDYKGRK